MAMGEWIKVTMPVETEHAEDVAGVIAYDFNVTVEIVEEEDCAILEMWFDSNGYIPGQVLDAVKEQFPSVKRGKLTISSLSGVDWLAKWKETLTPLPLGDEIIIVPSWWTGEVDKGRTQVILDPGMAFGTGHHPTTAGCIPLLEKYRGARILDVGCGSGILSICAAKLGAAYVLGVDIDPEVIPIARENIELNGVTKNVVVLEGILENVTGVFDVIVANLFMTPHLALAPIYRERLKPGGVLIVSGLLLEHGPPVDEALTKSGLTRIERLEIKDWVTMAYRA